MWLLQKTELLSWSDTWSGPSPTLRGPLALLTSLRLRPWGDTKFITFSLLLNSALEVNSCLLFWKYQRCTQAEGGEGGQQVSVLMPFIIAEVADSWIASHLKSWVNMARTCHRTSWWHFLSTSYCLNRCPRIFYSLAKLENRSSVNVRSYADDTLLLLIPHFTHRNNGGITGFNGFWSNPFLFANLLGGIPILAASFTMPVGALLFHSNLFYSILRAFTYFCCAVQLI